jgi:hypothetical protein
MSHAADAAALFYRPPSGRTALTQQRAVVAELFTSAFGAAVSDYADARVCRHFLAGLCVADLFKTGRGALPPCERLHDAALRRAYEARAPGAPGYEGELAAFLEGIVAKLERDGAIAISTRASEGGAVPRVDIDAHADVVAAAARVAAKAAELDAAGATADTARLEDELRELHAARLELSAQLLRDAEPAATTKWRCCSTCVSLLNLSDANARIAEHYSSSAHIGNTLIRAKLGELRGAAARPA